MAQVTQLRKKDQGLIDFINEWYPKKQDKLNTILKFRTYHVEQIETFKNLIKNTKNPLVKEQIDEKVKDYQITLKVLNDQLIQTKNNK